MIDRNNFGPASYDPYDTINLCRIKASETLKTTGAGMLLSYIHDGKQGKKICCYQHENGRWPTKRYFETS